MAESGTMGNDMVGNPPGTGPITSIPFAERFNAQLTMMAPDTAISAPGILLLILLPARVTTITTRESTSVGSCSMERFEKNDISCWPAPSYPTGRPVIPESCPMAIWIPTPVRNPIMTLRERKSAMNPSFNIPARKRKIAAIIAIIAA